MTMKRGVTVPLGIGLAAAGLTVAYAAYDTRRALVAWIAAYAFVVATVLAAAILVMTFHVTSAHWWRVLRRVFIAVLGTAPLLPVFFLPIAASLDLVYPVGVAARATSRGTSSARSRTSASGITRRSSSPAPSSTSRRGPCSPCSSGERTRPT